MSRVRVVNASRQRVLAEGAAVAETFFERSRGLLGRASLAPGEGLVIRPCPSIHTFFMRFPIDVLHVGADDRVLRVLHDLPPNRVGPLVGGSQYVVELPPGTAATTGTMVGDQLRLENLPE